LSARKAGIRDCATRPQRTQRLRIAYVINSLEGGGAAAPVPEVVRVLRDQGCEVRVLALSRRNGLAGAVFDAKGLDWAVSRAAARQHLRAAAWLVRELRALRPDVIWTSLTQATVIGQLAGAALRRPVVSWQHNAYLKRANLALLNALRPLASLWVADSEAVAELTVERLGLAPAAVMVWPLFQADAGAPKAQPFRPGEVFRFGSLGRLHRNKGYDVLVAAAARLEAERASGWPEFTIEIAGEGGERAALESQMAKLGVTTVRLVGFQHEPQRFLAGLHAYLQPSRAEGLCIAAHEALLAGLPVVAARVGEMPRTIEAARAGAVVAPEDADGLARKMGRLLSDPAAGAAAGRRGAQAVAAAFSRERFEAAGAAVVRRLRESILGGRAPGRAKP
jgi:glycosyltransferase involved in cell wall biosynthesis